MPSLSPFARQLDVQLGAGFGYNEQPSKPVPHVLVHQSSIGATMRPALRGGYRSIKESLPGKAATVQVVALPGRDSFKPLSERLSALRCQLFMAAPFISCSVLC